MVSNLIDERIIKSIFFIRKQKVMLDSDLAELYGVETRVLKQAVRRNIERFPSDFMFQLTNEEWKIVKSQIVTTNDKSLRSQNVTLENRRGKHSKYQPFVFTEQGVAMLSSVLKSERAIVVNIAIMSVFVKIRKYAADYRGLLKRLDKLNKTDKEQNKHIANIYRIIEELIKPQIENKNSIGF